MSKLKSSDALKAFCSAIRNGKAADVVDDIEKWGEGTGGEAPQGWDLVVGATFWQRCVEKGVTFQEAEVAVLERIYVTLARVFIKSADAVEQKEKYMERLTVFAATFKFFVAQKRVDLKINEELLQTVSKTSFHARKHDPANMKTVCQNFYAYIWNYMRENHAEFGVTKSLEHASVSIRWLSILGLDHFLNISNKICQINCVVGKNKTKIIADEIANFLMDLSKGIVKILKQVVLDESNNGVKVKTNKAVRPLLQFHGILSTTFVLARQLVSSGDFEKALCVFRPVTSIAKVYFDAELTQVWKNMAEAFVKICMVIMSGVNFPLTDELEKSSEAFRECRKQILDLKFQKAYPGYAFSLMYVFTESIGHIVSNWKSPPGSTSVLKQLNLSKFLKFTKEILLAADASVALDNMKWNDMKLSGKYSSDGMTEARKVDVQSAALFFLLKVASERISGKDFKANTAPGFKQLFEDVYRTVMTIANREDLERTKSAELLNLLTFHTCNIGYAYQKQKDFEEAMFWCKRSVDSLEAFRTKKVNAELKVSALSIGLLNADCLRQLGKYEEGLRWLSQWLVICPQYMSSQAAAYDIYEQIPWTDWSVHWQGLQREVCMKECKTVVEYLQETDLEALSDKKFVSQALRLEMNAYFSGRQTLVPAIIKVGDQLEELGYCVADQVLGLISQGVGWYWIGTSEHVKDAISCFEDALAILDQNKLCNDKNAEITDAEEATLKVYMTGVAMTWKGLANLKMHQEVASVELDAFRRRIIEANPDKKDKYDENYASPTFTSVTLQDEKKCVDTLSQAAECFYQLSQMEEVFKDVVDTHCPALAQVSIRMVAATLAAFGDKLNAVKAWYATYVVSKLYDRKGLVVLAASEVLKILPDPSMECVMEADKINEEAKKGNFIKHNKAVYHRLDLARAIAGYQTKNYKEGLQYLGNVYTFLRERDTFDSSHHLLAEADYLLSLFLSVALNQGLEFPPEIPQILCKMTPAGLTIKAYKLLGGLSRVMDPLTSGWTDLLHNYYLLATMAELSSRTVKVLKETGKMRDLKVFSTDAVYFYQSLGIISKSVSMLVPLIEIDINARNFCLAQLRIAAVAKVLMGSDLQPQKDAPDFTEAKQFLETQLKIPGLTISRLENVSNLKWRLDDLNVKSFHYRTRSQKYLTPLQVDCKNLNIKSMEMRAPGFLRHPLTCFCYTCSHLEIIPTALEFLAMQARYAVKIQWRYSMAILELSRLHHQRAQFRVLFSMNYITEQLQPIVVRKPASRLLHIMYAPFFFVPGLVMQLTNMEICPMKDIAYIVNLMNSALKLTDMVDSQDYYLKASPLELGTCALFEYFVTSGRVKIAESDLRQKLKTRVEQQEKENTILVPASPDLLEQTIPEPTSPPPLKRKGIPLPPTKQQQQGRSKAKVTSLKSRGVLNSKVQPHQKLAAVVELVDLARVDPIDEERRLPFLKQPNFDDSNDD